MLYYKYSKTILYREKLNIGREIKMMRLSPIIVSLLDTDLYKLNMGMVMFHKHTNLNGTYIFKCRNKDVVFTE